MVGVADWRLMDDVGGAGSGNDALKKVPAGGARGTWGKNGLGRTRKGVKGVRG